MQHVDQRGQAEHIRQEHEFMPFGVRDIAGPFQERDALLPFGMGQPGFAREVMQMGDAAADEKKA